MQAVVAVGLTHQHMQVVRAALAVAVMAEVTTALLVLRDHQILAVEVVQITLLVWSMDCPAALAL
jgi:hypothetical protein